MMPKVLITQKKCVVYYHYSYLQEYQPTSYSQCPGDGAGVLIFICQSLTIGEKRIFLTLTKLIVQLMLIAVPSTRLRTLSKLQ